MLCENSKFFGGLNYKVRGDMGGLGGVGGSSSGNMKVIVTATAKEKTALTNISSSGA